MQTEPIRHSDSLLIAWRLAEVEATNLQSSELEPVHFFLALLKLVELDLAVILADNTTLSNERIEEEVAAVRKLASCFESVGLDSTRARRRLRQSMPRCAGAAEVGRHLRRGVLSRDVFLRADETAAHEMSKTVEPLHLLAGILSVSCPWIQSALDQSAIREEDFSKAVKDELKEASNPLADKVPVGPKTIPLQEPKVPDKRKRAPGLVERLGRDLTELARQGSLAPIIGRKDEMRSLIQILLRRGKNNAILIGEAGVGKTGIVEGLAQRIADGAVPPEFRSKRIIEISMGSLIAGTNLRGDMEARLQTLVAEANRDPDMILFIDEIHLMVGAGQGSGAAMDAANLLKPALARGEVRVIGATTTREFRKFIEVDPALMRRFEVIQVPEPDRSEAIAILEGLRSGIECHHGVKIEESAVEASVDLAVRYLPDHRLPDKAIDVLDQACAQARFRSLSGDFRAQFQEGILIRKADVAAAVAHRCHLPIGELLEEESDKLRQMEGTLKWRIKGQDHAISVVADAIRMARSGLRNPNKPVGVFLFVGSSGTGKTELARALAQFLFGEERGLLRLDMSEFMEEHSVSKLIGSPPGFIGHDQGGQLTEKIRSRPFSVVLLDEIEKAHRKINDIFLQVFDTGFLTDAQGRKCDFREAVIIMTANLGAGSARPVIGFKTDEAAVPIEHELDESQLLSISKHFRPEFLNRLSEIVVFRPLEHKTIDSILNIFIEKLAKRLQEKDVILNVDEGVCELLILEGYSQEKGAREMERTVERLVAMPLSRLLLAGEIKNGAHIRCSAGRGGIEFNF